MSDHSIKAYFGVNLAELLSMKLDLIMPGFDRINYIEYIRDRIENKSYSQRLVIHAEALRHFIPGSFPEVIKLLLTILGEENPNETGMFKEYYWVLPIGKYVELFGLDHFEIAMEAIAEITKRNTGEYAIRPFISLKPERSLQIMTDWALSDNFHLRRLASEGLRPKLPWAKKLDRFIDNPEPVFKILEILKADPVKFVQKSVANHLTDYLKVNPGPTRSLIRRWSESKDSSTQWIIKRATRKIQ